MGFRENEWSNATGELGGKPAWLRRNESLVSIDRSAFPFLLIVHLVLDDVDEDGLPIQEENEIAGEFEERLADHFESQFKGLFAIAITNDATRDVFIYLPSRVDDETVAAAIDASDATLNYDFGVHDADDWGLYDTFA